LRLMNRIMKRILITTTLLFFGLTYTTAQRNSSKEERARLTPEQRMASDYDKKKGKGRSVDVSKKVNRAKKQDRSARKTKPPKHRRTPKRK
jgi:hypothetical protein